MNTYRLKTILAPTDFSDVADKALDCAIEITKANHGKLVLTHVLEAFTHLAPVEMMTVSSMHEQLFDASNSALKKLASNIVAEHQIRTDYKSFSGHVYDNIIRAAHIFNADLIVMGTHGTTGINQWLFGSNAYHVVNNSTLPVLTVNRHSSVTRFRKLVFPFTDNPLTLRKFEPVIAFAKLFQAEICLFGFAAEQDASAVLRLRQVADELTRSFAAENIPCSFAMNVGSDYAEEILAYAGIQEADLITVITHRGAQVDSILRSQPDRKLVTQSSWPVLSVPTG